MRQDRIYRNQRIEIETLCAKFDINPASLPADNLQALKFIDVILTARQSVEQIRIYR